MNRERTKEVIEENGVVTLQVDKTHAAPEGDDLLVRLGNKNKQIPFIAIFPAGNPNEPILLDGVLTSPEPVIEALKKAGPSRVAESDTEDPAGMTDPAATTAMRGGQRR